MGERGTGAKITASAERLMSPPPGRGCHFCYTSFLIIQDINSDSAVPPRVISALASVAPP